MYMDKGKRSSREDDSENIKEKRSSVECGSQGGKGHGIWNPGGGSALGQTKPLVLHSHWAGIILGSSDPMPGTRPVVTSSS